MTSSARQEPSAEQGKRLDSVAAHAGVVSESQHHALRADIRLLSTLLGETLVRQCGEELLELVKQVRGLTRAALLEGSAVAYYLEQLGTHAVPDLLEDLEDELARAAFALPPRSRPVVLGCWVGGDRDGNPNVSPQVTLDVLRLYADRALNIQLALIDQLIQELSVSTRVVGVSERLRRSIAHDRRPLPEVYDRYLRLNADEPYRLKCSFIHARLTRTQQRIRDGVPHQEGRDYLGAESYVADLEVMDASLRGHLGERIAEGTLARTLRSAGALGLHLAALDMREHADKHHAALAALYDALGELPRPYAELDRGERAASTYIVSMSKGVDDVFAAAVLAREAGLVALAPLGGPAAGGCTCTVDLVPLFERATELRCAGELLDVMLRDPSYRQLVRARANTR